MCLIVELDGDIWAMVSVSCGQPGRSIKKLDKCVFILPTLRLVSNFSLTKLK